MAILVGALLALSVAVFASVAGLDRDKAFYPTVVIMIASYYELFALIGDSLQALTLESMAILAFIVAAVAGFRTSQWLAVIALAAHGVFDFFHGELIANPGVPTFWPGFCLAYDVTAAICLAFLLSQSRLRAAVRRRAGTNIAHHDASKVHNACHARTNACAGHNDRDVHR